MGEWMVPRCYRINGSENDVLVTKASLFLGVFEVFEKTRGLSRLPHSYFLYVGVARSVTKLFRIEEESMPVAEIKTDRNSFTEIPQNP